MVPPPPPPPTDDDDESAILRRRNRFVALALGGLALGPACGDDEAPATLPEAPVAEVAEVVEEPERVEPTDVEEEPKPEPEPEPTRLEDVVGIGDIGDIGRPNACLGISSLPRACLSPQPCLSVEQRVRGRVQIASVDRAAGELDQPIVQRVVRQRLGAVRRCYENQLRRNPQLEGAITAAMTVAPTGRVAAASIEADSVGNAELSRCIVSVLRRFRLPTSEPAGESRYQIRFAFTPQD